MKIQSPLATTQLLVSGNTILSGTLDVENNTTVAGELSVGGDIIPATTDQYDLGSPSNRFKDIYLSGSTIFLGDVKLSESEEGGLKVVDAGNNEVIVGEVDTSSIDLRLDSLESESGSVRNELNNFTSSAEQRLDSLEVESGSIRTTFNNFTGSLGNIITQNSSSVTITGGSINGTSIGGTSASTGAFTTLTGSTSITTPLVTNAGTLALSATGANVITASTNGVERMRIDGAGEVLVGLTSRVTGLSGFTQLEVSGDEGGITINSNTTTADRYSRLMFTKSGATGGEGLIRYNVNDYHMSLWTNASEKMRITSAGNVGIGTTAPRGKLELLNNVAGNPPVQYLVGDDLLGDIRFARQQGILSFPNSYAMVRGLFGSGDLRRTNLTFWTSDTGDTTERLRITNTGNVGIGTSSPTFLLELPNVASDAGGRGRSNQWATYSDGRIKTDREALPYGLDAVMQLEPLRYFHHNSKQDENGNVEILAEGEVSIGLVAQDVAQVIPEIVSVPEDLNKDLCSLDYAKLNAVLIKAIQEQQAIIESLKARLDAANL